MLPPAVCEQFLALLDRPEVHVRHAVAEACRYLHGTGARDPGVLQRLVAHREDPLLLPALIHALGAGRSADGLPELRDLLAGAPEQLRVEVLTALAACGDVQPAIDEFEHAGAARRRELATPIWDFGGRRGHHLLRAVLEDEADDVELRRDILALFSERGEDAIARRFEHLRVD